ncbi:MAG: 4-hydroxy-3-methylbut-2-en-yl diphosphate reductase [Acidobacteriota bacterium]|nr:4-hydroxy-3-methylbut-2-en-yl diphosphate reductase [Acidobacteriota bacterium]
MKIYTVKESGFCFGVKRALNIIYGLNEQKQDTQIYGQLIHNKTALDQLEAKGIETIQSLDRLDPRKKLVIRTHGIKKDEEERLKKEGIDYVDATCPLVKNLHHIIEKLQNKDTQILIIGDKNHPEVIAAQSYGDNVTVINSEAEAAAMKKADRLDVLAQTTLDSDHFERIVALLAAKAGKLEVHNTICNTTKVRQEAIKKLAPRVDFVVVLGGKNSSNTRKLYNIALNRNKNTFYIQKSSHLNDPAFIAGIKDFRSVAIAAGASTPPGEIEEAKNILRNINLSIEKETNNGKRKRNCKHNH